MLSVRLEFGYWVFEGDGIPAQRPSWNYRAEDGGGIVLDMFPHWQYLLTNLFGPITALYARTRHAHPAALGRVGHAPTTRPPTMPPTRCSSSPAGRSPR